MQSMIVANQILINDKNVKYDAPKNREVKSHENNWNSCGFQQNTNLSFQEAKMTEYDRGYRDRKYSSCANTVKEEEAGNH